MPDTRSQYQVRVEIIGQEKNPLLIIDNFVPTPEELLEQAVGEPQFATQASDFYPGLRKLISGDYPTQTLHKIIPLVREIFSIAPEPNAQMSLCAFSLTTTPPEKLRPIQSVPHIDTHDPLQFAMVHYLCTDSFGGTSFYRHRSSGFETINQQRFTNYFKNLKQEVMDEQQTHFNYINGDTRLFEHIYQVPVVFNRAIIYRSNQLHSADIGKSSIMSSDPMQGRLTANSFFQFA